MNGNIWGWTLNRKDYLAILGVAAALATLLACSTPEDATLQPPLVVTGETSFFDVTITPSNQVVEVGQGVPVDVEPNGQLATGGGEAALVALAVQKAGETATTAWITTQS